MRLFHALIAALLLALPLTAHAAPPNIVFILADDLGYGDLGCYGQKLIATPHLDQLAAEGVRFTNAYAGSTVCSPSRCSLLTGRHTGHARIRGNGNVPLAPEDPTLAKLLKANGYRTALFGKWGIGEPDGTGAPLKQGFDEFFGYTENGHAHDFFPEWLWRGDQKEPIPGNKTGPKRGVCEQCGTYANDLFAKEALAFLDRAKDAPFFLYLPFTIPHSNNERKAVTGDGFEVPDFGAYADKPWDATEKHKAAMISRLDGYVGEVRAKLEALGLDKNTLVLFSSDNGPHIEGGGNAAFFNSGGGLRGHKRDLYEGGIREPFLAWWPGTIAPAVCDAPIAFWDVLPTLADLLKTSAPENDGVSFLPALFGKPLAERPYFYWEFHEGGFKRAVRMGHWKGVKLRPDMPLELYDLATDAPEALNIADAHRDVVAELEKILAEARTPNKDWPGS